MGAGLMRFDRNGYLEWLADGTRQPPDVFPPFINVSRAEYHRLGSDSRSIELAPLRERMGSGVFARTRGALGLTLRFASRFFPAYRFFVDEFLNDEWLAAVDWHKGFHRDHVIHQPYVAYVGMTLLNDSGGIFEFLNDGEDGNGDGSDYSSGSESGDRETMLDRCVDAILGPGRCGYLVDYLAGMGAPQDYFNHDSGRPAERERIIDRMIEEECAREDRQAREKRREQMRGRMIERTRWLWKCMFADTFFLAALFHDIGYPWRFVNEIHKRLAPHAPLENPATQSDDEIAERYAGRLVFYPLNDYRGDDPAAPAGWRAQMKELVSKGLRKTHGLPGALAFLHLNDLLSVYPSGAAAPERRFCVEWAAMAIMQHDMAGLYSDVDFSGGGLTSSVENPQLRVSFLRDPLSFVLTLSDLIEDFGRPDAGFTRCRGGADGGDTGSEGADSKDNAGAHDRNDCEENRRESNSVRVNFMSRCPGVDVECDSHGGLKIKYEYCSPLDVANKRAQFIPKETRQYFDGRDGYLDFEGTGITSVRMEAHRTPEEAGAAQGVGKGAD